jgi:vitamin B12 transporter
VWLSAGGSWKVRASGGSAFRAPTVGELYFPFGANPNLEPERSVSWEVGLESYLVAGGHGEISIFWNDLKDLIVFEFVTGTNENVGRARTRGVELGWRQEVLPNLAVDATYTYLDAENRVTGEPLIRRPRHRGALGLLYRPHPPLELAARGLFVGRRPDLDPLSFGPTEDPSYFRLDFFLRWDFGAIAPYARLENALDRQYDEAAGFPAPVRRVVGGLDVRF